MDKIIEGNEWVDIVVKQPLNESDAPYIHFQNKKETVAAIIYDMYTQEYILRVEPTLPSNFSPVPKIMSETMEGDETSDMALIRGIKEELGLDISEDSFAYLGKLKGTYESLHNFYLYFVIVDGYNTYSDFEGDGSEGERNSMNLKVRPDMIITEDWLWLTAFGLLKAKLASGDEAIMELLQRFLSLDYLQLNAIL